MRMHKLARNLASNGLEEQKSIDFGASGLYLPAAQTFFATTPSSCVPVLACWLIPVGAISAVRTLALMTTAGLLVIRRPIRIGQTRRVNTIFSSLRPCSLIYVACLVLEQLIHTCISEESTCEHGFWRRIIYHANMTIMTFAAFLRAKTPRRVGPSFPDLYRVNTGVQIQARGPPVSGELCLRVCRANEIIISNCIHNKQMFLRFR